MKRSSPILLRSLAFAAVVAGVIAGSVFFFSSSGRDAAPEPDITPLRQILEESADAALPPPKVAEDEITVKIGPGRSARAEIEHAIEVAAELGGVALESSPGGHPPEVFAQIPRKSVEMFRRRVTRTVTEVSSGKDPQVETAETALITVRFIPEGAPDPTSAPSPES